MNTEPTARPEGSSSNSQSAASLAFQNVTKVYRGSTEAAIQDLSLEIPAGEICVFVGPSGCGKTTAMRLVNRMIDLTSGDIRLDGESVTALAPAELRRRIGYAIQQIGLFPHLTIGDNIATVPKLLGWPKARIHDRIDELIDLIGLDGEMRDRYPAQLSGGQRQRVGVARALAADPPLMLMDEPFGAIDPISRERLQNEFLRLQERIGKTVIFVTHDIDEAIKMGDRIAVLKQGGVLAQYATPAELLMAPADDFVQDFVGADRALKRLALLRVRDIDLWRAPNVRIGEATSRARELAAQSEVPHPIVIDDAGRPLGWMSAVDLQRETVSAPTGRTHARIELDDILRDALANLLEGDAQYGAVVDDSGRLVGVLSIEIIADFLTRDEASADAAQGVAPRAGI